MTALRSVQLNCLRSAETMSKLLGAPPAPVLLGQPPAEAADELFAVACPPTAEDGGNEAVANSPIQFR